MLYTEEQFSEKSGGLTYEDIEHLDAWMSDCGLFVADDIWEVCNEFMNGSEDMKFEIHNDGVTVMFLTMRSDRVTILYGLARGGVGEQTFNTLDHFLRATTERCLGPNGITMCERFKYPVNMEQI